MNKNRMMIDIHGGFIYYWVVIIIWIIDSITIKWIKVRVQFVKVLIFVKVSLLLSYLKQSNSLTSIGNITHLNSLPIIIEILMFQLLILKLAIDTPPRLIYHIRILIKISKKIRSLTNLWIKISSEFTNKI